MRLCQSHVKVFMKRGLWEQWIKCKHEFIKRWVMGYNSFKSNQWNVAKKVRCYQKLVMYRGNHFYQCIVLCLMNQRWSLSPRQKALTIVPSLVEKSGSKLFEHVICIKMNMSIIKHLLITELPYCIEE